MLPYRDANLSPESRADDLLGRMTLDEKLAQMRLIADLHQHVTPDEFIEKFPDGLGATYSTGAVNSEMLYALQKAAVTRTRLGIPMLSASESIHGLLAEGATVFPQCIGLGSTFDPELIGEIADAIGHEAKAKGINTTFAPNLDLSRDPRWGRVEENYGEDPYLTSRMGAAYVRSLQKNGVAACPKHYIAHGSPESGINLGPVHAGERELRETMLEPFEAAIKEAGALTVMPGYSELDGIPLHASRFLLTDLLRGELGFKGCTISDFGAVDMLHSFQHVTEDAESTAAVTLKAGLDIEAPDAWAYGDALKRAFKDGRVSIDEIDLAVRRILYVKFKLGLFENPFEMPDISSLMHTRENVELARRAATESIVLLKNEENVLPLDRAPGTIAVIGPSACLSQVGDYSARPASGSAVTVYSAMKERLGADKVLYAEGCGYTYGTDEKIAEAVSVAEKADKVVLVLGDNSNFWAGVGWGDDNNLERDASVTCGEGFDMSDLKLPGRQQELLERVSGAGKPVILLLMTGRPYCVGWAKEHVPAILQTWYPGEQGGNAICDILFGDVDPSGRLPITFPKSVGHIPCFYNHKVSARGFYKKPGTPEQPGRDYVFSSPEPLFAFGNGLSYTTFAYSGLKVTPESIGEYGTVTVSVDVKNTGKRDGIEVVQLYLSDLYSRITPFVKRLRRFSRVKLRVGESKKVVFELNRNDFTIVNERMEREVEPGVFLAEIGGQTAEFKVV